VQTQQALSCSQFSRHNVSLTGDFCPRRPAPPARVHATPLSTWFQIVLTPPVVDLRTRPRFILAITLLQRADKFFRLAMQLDKILISEFLLPLLYLVSSFMPPIK